jgi:hypothetical protein
MNISDSSMRMLMKEESSVIEPLRLVVVATF